MQAWIIVVLIIAILLILIVFRVVYEMHHLKVTTYNISSEKINAGQGKRFVFLSDLHLRTYGKNNIKLIETIKANEPDYILLGGDMVTASPGKKDDAAINLLENISKIAPVFYAPGNHEKDLEVEPDEFGDRFEKLVLACKKSNIKYLDNKKEDIFPDISVIGLDVEFKYYKKINTPKLSSEHIKEILPSLDKTRYNILLAHNPGNFEEYEKLEPDLILSGHYHGGVIRLPFGRGLITPRFLINANYTWGTFIKNNTRMIVSCGVGSHKVNIRLLNRPEVVVVNLKHNA